MKNFKKIMNIAKSNEEVNFGRKTTEIGAGFKKFLQKISTELDSCNSVQIVVEQDLNNSEIGSENSKVFRVKPKTKKINYSG